MPAAAVALRIGVDEDKAASRTILLVGIEEDRTESLNFHQPDIVHHQSIDSFLLQGLYVDAMPDRGHARAHGLRRMFQQIGSRAVEWLSVKPYQRGGDGAAASRAGSSTEAIRSPRLMSNSSSRVTAIDCGAFACSRFPSKVEIDAMRVLRPEGRATTRSPTRTLPAAICPANPRKLGCA